MFKNKYILIRNLAVLLIVNNLLYWIFLIPPVVWRIALVLLSFYVILSEKSKKSSVEKAVFVFIIFNLIHFLVSFIWSNPATTFIGNILCALLPLGLFVCLEQKGVLKDGFFSLISIIFLVASVLAYYHSRTMTLMALDKDLDTDLVNNMTVSFLFLLPLIFLIKNDTQKFIILGFCVFFLLSGAKRGNILAAIIPIALLIWYIHKDSHHSTTKSLITIVAIIVLSVLSYKWFTTSDLLIARIESTIEGDSSRRDIIYKNAFNTWYNSNDLIKYIFGYGYEATGHLIHSSAHSDWLEILVNYGLLGVFLYFIIFLTLGDLIMRIRKDIITRLILISALYIWLLKSIYSMAFTEGYMMLLMISLGTAIGRTKSIQSTMTTNNP